MSRVSAPKRPYFGSRAGGVRIAVLPTVASAATHGFGDCAWTCGTGEPDRAAIRDSEATANRRRGMRSLILSSGGW